MNRPSAKKYLSDCSSLYFHDSEPAQNRPSSRITAKKQDNPILIQQTFEQIYQNQLSPQKYKLAPFKADTLFKNGYYRRLSSKLTEKKVIPTISLRDKNFQKIKQEWNSSINTKQQQCIKSLNVKIIDLTNENQNLKAEMECLKEMHREALKSIQNMHQIMDNKNPVENKMSLNLEEQLEIFGKKEELIKRQEKQKREQLMKRLRESEEKVEQLSKLCSLYVSENVRLHQQSEGRVKERMKEAQKIIHQCAQMQLKRLDAIAIDVNLLATRVQNQESRIKGLQYQKTLRFSRKPANVALGVEPVVGDVEEPNEHHDELMGSDDSKLHSKAVNTSEEIIRSAPPASEKELSEKKYQDQIADLNKQLQLRPKVEQSRVEQAKAFNSQALEVLQAIKEIKQNLQNCNTSNFDYFCKEFESLIQDRRHLRAQLHRMQNSKNWRVWQLQKQLQDAKQKNMALVEKCVDLQNYIQKNMDGGEKREEFIVEGIYDKFTVYRCCCAEIGDDYSGDEAIEWTKYVKSAIDESVRKMGVLLSQFC